MNADYLPFIAMTGTSTTVFLMGLVIGTGLLLIGLGLGPLLFGMMSDAFKPLAGDESVRWVLYGAAWLGLVPAFFFWRASLRLKEELKTG